MSTTLCNPQIVLGHLMGRFGRSLHAGRGEGRARMVTSISDSLGLDHEEASRQVDLLGHCGLLFFDAEGYSAGVWHIGPCV